MKKFFEGFSDFLLRFGDAIWATIFMGYLMFYILFVGIASSLGFWSVLGALFIFCIIPFTAGYIFKRWQNREIKRSIGTAKLIRSKIEEIEKNLDTYSKEDLVGFMKIFEDRNEDIIEFF